MKKFKYIIGIDEAGEKVRGTFARGEICWEHIARPSEMFRRMRKILKVYSSCKEARYFVKISYNLNSSCKEEVHINDMLHE